MHWLGCAGLSRELAGEADTVPGILLCANASLAQ